MDIFLKLVESFLNNEISYDVFEGRICDLYEKDEIGFDNLPSTDSSFVYDVYEKTTYTGKEVLPKDPDRRYGVIDKTDFPAWLQNRKKQYFESRK